MYIPKTYKNENPDEIRAFLKANGFGILVNQTNGKLWATHIPMILDTDDNGNEILHSHISKLNPQAEGFTENDQVLAIFSGSHSYISSSWYDHENVPTWNYSAVHIYGRIKIVEQESALRSLKKLVDRYEANSEKPIRIENLSEKTMQEARGIIGFEIEIEEIQAVKKLSQNRDDKNYKNIISELEKTQDMQAIAVAKEMGKCRK
ncbi:FMN-binding negative transcriptional regulator [Flavobacterium sp. TMP13]|uniref:FMN-binding negative transcriptional regulator n=1 Tax=unclassified Flavobacterium TaxID=196869 RepID=UPI00076CBD09|nr:FMN-binding negative transcriptional regulator [Flavobacterium sp. TAB 87]KVV15955.1 Protease synthase and sporulation protein PAI 2 [Flavobacterium sp. TAB 87]